MGIRTKMSRIRKNDYTEGDCVKPAYRGVPALSHNPVEAVRTSLRALHPVAVLEIKVSAWQFKGVT
jgi:hypothetical protein